MSERTKDAEISAVSNFGLLVGFIVAAFFSFRLGSRGAGTFNHLGLSIGAILMFLGMLAPTLLKPAYKVWMLLAAGLGWFNTRLILGLIFTLMVVPCGMIARYIFGRDLIDAAIDGEKKDSYWLERSEGLFKPEKLERMF